MSLDAVERQGMPFVGESGGLGSGRVGRAPPRSADRAPDRAGLPPDPTLAERLAEARRRADDPSGSRRAARPAARQDAAVTSATQMVPAVGGTRLVPAPDPIASDYLLLGLRLDQHLPGLIDGYYGPADLKARVETEQLRSPRRLLDDVASLAERVDGEVGAPDRRAWLIAQLQALDAHARALAGEPLSYPEYVERCMGFAPRRHDDGEFRCRGRGDRRSPPGPWIHRGAHRRMGPTRSRSPRTASRRWRRGCSSASGNGRRTIRAARWRDHPPLDRPGPGVDRVSTGTSAAAGRGSRSTSTCR